MVDICNKVFRLVLLGLFITLVEYGLLSLFVYLSLGREIVFRELVSIVAIILVRSSASFKTSFLYSNSLRSRVDIRMP